MNKWLELLIGLILIIVSVLVLIYFDSWRFATWQLIKGGIILLVMLIGLLFILLGISDIKG